MESVCKAPSSIGLMASRSLAAGNLPVRAGLSDQTDFFRVSEFKKLVSDPMEGHWQFVPGPNNELQQQNKNYIQDILTA